MPPEKETGWRAGIGPGELAEVGNLSDAREEVELGLLLSLFLCRIRILWVKGSRKEGKTQGTECWSLEMGGSFELHSPAAQARSWLLRSGHGQPKPLAGRATPPRDVTSGDNRGGSKRQFGKRLRGEVWASPGQLRCCFGGLRAGGHIPLGRWDVFLWSCGCRVCSRAVSLTAYSPT